MWSIEVLPILEDNYTFVIFENEKKEAIVVDPGTSTEIQLFTEKNKLNIKYILITHHHPDHINGVRALKENSPALKIGIYKMDSEKIGGDLLLEEGLTDFLGLSCFIKNCQGHTRNHVVYYFKELNALFCGDVLFHLGCGRLFEGTPEDLHKSLSWILTLPNESSVYCGHEYTLKNLEFCKKIFSKLVNHEKLEEDIRYRIAATSRTIPFTLETDKKWNPFLRFHDTLYRKHLEAQSEIEFLSVLRALKDTDS